MVKSDLEEWYVMKTICRCLELSSA